MGSTLNFIEIWLKLLNHDYEVRFGMYNKFMKDVLKEIPTTMTKTLLQKEIIETYDINWWWVVHEKNAKGLPPLRRPKLSKKAQEKEDEIKNIYMKLISGGMIGNSNCIGTILNGLIQEVKSKGKNPNQYLQKVLHK